MSPLRYRCATVPEQMLDNWELIVAVVAALPSLLKQQSPGLLFLDRVPQFQNKCWIIGSLIVAAVAALPSLSKQQSLRIIVSRQSATVPYIFSYQAASLFPTQIIQYIYYLTRKTKKINPLF